MSNLSDATRRQLNIITQLLETNEQKSVVEAIDYAATEAVVAVATTTEAGTVLQGAAVADGAVPFASLTTAAQKVNELLASLRAAGIIAT